MNETYQIILSIIATVVLTIPIVLWYLKLTKERNTKRKEAKKELIDLLSRAIKESRIENYIDFKDFVFGYEKIELLRLNFPYAFKELAFNAKHSLINNSLNIETSKKIIEEIKKQIDDEIKETELKVPFKNVPTEERNLLIDITEISQLKTNKVFIEKLHKLGDLIRMKDEVLIKSGKDNEESLRIAKQSKLLAILFFIISLGLTIFSIWK